MLSGRMQLQPEAYSRLRPAMAAQLLLLCALPLNVLATCRAHPPCCICLYNLCAKGHGRGNASACDSCMAKNKAELLGPICHCQATDFDPWCATTMWGCECHHTGGTECMCTPSVAGEFSTEADCNINGCPSKYPPPPPGPEDGLQLPEIFANDMVLQSEGSNIHGSAPSGALVTLTASPTREGFPLNSTAGGDGKWRIDISAQPISLASTELTIASAGQPPFVLSGVLWGDVYLCGGQSNMLIPADYILENSSTIAQAVALNASLRLLEVAPGVQMAVPQDNVRGLTIPWSIPTQERVPSFSAVCLSFALQLVAQRPELAQRPMGLVVSASSGTPLEAWMTAKSASACPGVPKSAGCNHIGNVTSGLFNGQIYPLRQVSIKLVIWYQGESNALWRQFPLDAHLVDDYACRYTSLIDGWRDTLSFVNQGKSKIGWLTIQIAPWLGPRSSAIFPAIRLAQQHVADTLYDVGTVVTQDLGDPLNPPPYASMHPRNKTFVGARLATAALALKFVEVSDSDAGQVPPGDPAWGGPAFQSIARTSAAGFTVKLFRARALRTVGSDKCADAGPDDNGTTRPTDKRCCDAPDVFQIWPNVSATEAKRADAASASASCTIAQHELSDGGGSDTDSASLHCTSTRGTINDGAIWTFAWQNFPPCMLMNQAQLPASPMRVEIPPQVDAR